MAHAQFSLTPRNDPDGLTLQCYSWLPDDKPVAVVQIAHGMGEHALRYGWAASCLNAAGYAVYANDHRGHGGTMGAVPGYMGQDGWNRTIADAAQLSDYVAERHPDLPLVLLGHSMGAMLSQQYLYRYGRRLTAAALSGSPGLGGRVQLWVSHLLARFERWRLGADGESRFLQDRLFSSSNAAFDHEDATGFEWLSRDSAQVQAYVGDDKCGFVLTAGSLADLFGGAREARKADRIDRIPKDLPIYVFSGSADPVHGEQTGLDRLIEAYENAGLTLTRKIYAEGRHELLNETNREEVMEELIAWLNAQCLNAANHNTASNAEAG